MGKKTGDYALAMAVDYVKQIKKTPIVVNDSRGFYTSRCFGTYVAEGQEMLAEGIAPAIIDNVGRMTGMPRGPLELADDVALDLAYKVREQTKKDLGDKYEAGPADTLIENDGGQARPLWAQERQGLLRLSGRRRRQEASCGRA